MTKEAQRIAIATACGWKWQEGTEPTYGGTNIPRGWFNPRTKRLSIDLPDYLNDLNAMHWAEKALVSQDQKIEYLEQLYVLNFKGDQNPDTFIEQVLSTAAQRAEAFLRCLNLWKE